MAQVERATSSGGKKYLTNVLSEFIFDTNGWKEFGWVNMGGRVVKVPCFLTVFIPENIKVTSAKLYISLGSKYVSGAFTELGILDGYYCVSNIKLYTGVQSNNLYLDYQYNSEPLIIDTGIVSSLGNLNTVLGTWNPTGSGQIQTKEIDITNEIITGQKFKVSLVGGNDSAINTNYTDSGIVNMELVVTGYVR